MYQGFLVVCLIFFTKFVSQFDSCSVLSTSITWLVLPMKYPISILLTSFDLIIRPIYPIQNTGCKHAHMATLWLNFLSFTAGNNRADLQSWTCRSIALVFCICDFKSVTIMRLLLQDFVSHTGVLTVLQKLYFIYISHSQFTLVIHPLKISGMWQVSRSSWDCVLLSELDKCFVEFVPPIVCTMVDFSTECNALFAFTH